MTLKLSALVPHVPSMCHEENAPEFQKEMVEAMKGLSKKIADIEPDAIVLVSCHWPATFNHYVNTTPELKGVLTAIECPDLIYDVPYEYKGDEKLGNELVEAGREGGIQVVGFNDPYYVLDYGTVVPLRYLNPLGNIPVVNLSVTLAANLDETYRWGKEICSVLEKSDKKYVFLASGALSHNLVRGRENAPTRSERALDRQFVDYLMNEEYISAFDMLPQYARSAKVESGGRHLAILLSLLEGKKTKAEYIAEGQSSGSWNAVVTFDYVSERVEEKETAL